MLYHKILKIYSVEHAQPVYVNCVQMMYNKSSQKLFQGTVMGKNQLNSL